jgi:hypothetical protein
VDPVRINLTGFRSDTTEKRTDPDPPEPDHVFVFMRILDLIIFSHTNVGVLHASIKGYRICYEAHWIIVLLSKPTGTPVKN